MAIYNEDQDPNVKMWERQNKADQRTTEIISLQNLADKLSLTVHEKFTQDGRQTVKRYFASNKDGTSVSPVLTYIQLNCFLLGWLKCHRITAVSLLTTK